MKKLLITIICILAVLTFASCSNNNSNDLASGKSISQESSSYENEESKSANSSASDKYNVKNKDIEKVFYPFMVMNLNLIMIPMQKN